MWRCAVLAGLLAVAMVAAKPVPTLSLDFEQGMTGQGPAGAVTPTLEGQPVLVDGKFGKALKSGPGTGYLHFPTAGILRRETGTVEMWVCPVDWPGNEEKFHAFFDCHGDGALYLYKYYQGGLLMLTAPHMDGPYHSASATITAWKPGEWHHIAGTWSPTMQRVYVDGKVMGNAPPELPTKLGDTFLIGDHPWHIARTSSSLVDQVRVYDRTLSPAHIAAHAAGDFDKTVDIDAQSTWLTLRVDPATRTLAAQIDSDADTTTGVMADVSISANGKAVRSATPVSLEPGSACANLPLAELPEGTYEVTARLHRGDQQVAVLTKPFGIPGTAWVGNTLGLEDKVLPPWTALKTRTERGTTVVECLGRRYDLGGAALPQQMHSAGADLLHGPVSVVPVVAGRPVGPQWGSASATSTDTTARLRGEGRLGPITLQTQATAEYDGLVVYDLAIGVPAGTKLDSLHIDIPLQRQVALYRHRWAATWAGETGALPAGPVPDSGEFVPYIWLGDNDRGLFWFCESGQDWPNYAAKDAWQIVREGDAVVLRLNLLAAGQAVPANWHYRFGLQATPVKPLTREWRRRRMNPAPKGNLDILWPTPSPDSQTYYGYPEARDPEKFAKRVDAAHAKGVAAIPYSCLSFFSQAAPEWPFYQKSWQTGAADTGSSDVAAYNAPFAMINPTSKSYQDFIIWKNVQFMKQYHLDGYYHDNSHPYGMSTNVEGGGWTDAKGQGHPTYPILAYRQLYRRLYHVVKDPQPDRWLMAHMSGKVCIPFLAYEDAYLDGEHFRGRVKDCYLDLLPMDTFRAEFMGRQWGLQPFFLPEFDQEHAARIEPTRGLMGMLLVHDVQPWAIWCNPKPVNDMYAALDAFGYVDSEFIPYFDPQPPARTDLPNVYASAYRRDDGRALLVVANVGREPRHGPVTLDAKRLGLPLDTLVTWPAKEKVALKGETLDVDLAGLDYRLYVLGKQP